MMVAVVVLRIALPSDISPTVRFFTEVPVGAATYGAVLFGLHRDRLLAFRSILRMARSPDS